MRKRPEDNLTAGVVLLISMAMVIAVGPEKFLALSLIFILLVYFYALSNSVIKGI